MKCSHRWKPPDYKAFVEATLTQSIYQKRWRPRWQSIHWKPLGGKASAGKHDRPARGNWLLRVTKGPQDHERGIAPYQGARQRHLIPHGTGGKASTQTWGLSMWQSIREWEPTHAQHQRVILGVLLWVTKDIMPLWPQTRSTPKSPSKYFSESLRSRTTGKEHKHAVTTTPHLPKQDRQH